MLAIGHSGDCFELHNRRSHANNVDPRCVLTEANRCQFSADVENFRYLRRGTKFVRFRPVPRDWTDRNDKTGAIAPSASSVLKRAMSNRG